jgi:hypothetical protein
MAADDDDGTIVFDRRMANVLISSHIPADALKSREKESGEPPPSTEETTLMSSEEPEVPWIRRNWAAVAGGGAAAAALVVALLVAVVLGSGVETPGGRPGAGGGPSSRGRGGGVLPAGKPVLRISELRGILPEGTRVGVQIGEAPPYEVSELDDQAVEPGPVKLTVSRPNYKPIEHVFEMAVGKEQELTKEMFRLEPDEAFAKLIEEARSLIEAKKFSAADTALEKIGLKDPSAPFLGEIKSRLAEAKAAWNDHWSAIFDEAKGLLEDGKAEEAGKLLAKIPDQHHAYPARRRSSRRSPRPGR